MPKTSPRWHAPGDALKWSTCDLSVSYLISSKHLLFENITHDGSLKHCTWLYLDVTRCTWLYLALPRSAMISYMWTGMGWVEISKRTSAMSTNDFIWGAHNNDFIWGANNNDAVLITMTLHAASKERYMELQCLQSWLSLKRCQLPCSWWWAGWERGWSS